jgi:glycosyltransferase involved in cell wall biosynthesis
MNILHVAAGLQETCGVSRFVVECARAQQRAGHQVVIVTSMTCGYPVDDLDVRISDTPQKIDISPDIVHLHSIWNQYVHAMAAWSRSHGTPYLVSPHGTLTPWALRYKWWKKIPALLLYQYHDLAKARAFHVTMPAEEKDLRRLRLHQPVTVAPLGIEIPPEEKRSQGDNTPRDLLFLGRLHPVKNLDGLLHAWARLPSSRRCGWRLIFAGPDDVGYQQELVSLARRLDLPVADLTPILPFGKKQIHGGQEVPLEWYQNQLRNRTEQIIFTGAVYGEAKSWLYRHARFFILPSHSENFGDVILTALANGVPAIATIGTPWQCLPTAQCGWWIEPTPEALADTLAQAMTMPPGQYAAWGVNARALAARDFSWQRTADTLLEAYRKIVPAGRPE